MLGDLRTALRSLFRDKRFTLAAMVTLALGVGATSAIFSLTDALVLHPFPQIDAPDRVLWLFETSQKVDLDRDDVAAANFADWRAQAKDFEAFGAMGNAELTLTSGEPERVAGLAVSSGYFAVLGLHPALGRFFTPADEQPGQPPVAVLGHELWQRRFGGDPQIVGQVIELNGKATTVVGVLPAGLMFPRTPEVMIPLSLDAAAWANRKDGAFAAFARLAPGVSLAEATAELDLISGRLAADHPDTNRGLTVSPVPIAEVFSVKGAVLPLLVAVAFVLLIACANVANLLLARGVARRRDLAVRQALGASRARLVRQLLIETLVLAVGGAALGLVLANFSIDLLLAALPPRQIERVPVLMTTAVNLRVVGFAALLAGAVTLLCGLVPALRSSRIDLNAALKDAGTGTGRPRRARLMSALVVVEAALAMVLLSSAGVTVRGLMALSARPLGFRSEGIFTLRLPLEGRHPDHAERVRFVDQVLARVGGAAGVDAVAMTSDIPSTDNGGVVITVVGTAPPPREEQPVAHLAAVTPDFFRVLGLPITNGRGFTDADRGAADAPIVLSAAAARWLFKDGEPLGQRVHLGEGFGDRLIVGIAGDVPEPTSRSSAIGAMYIPFAGEPSTMLLTLRGAQPAVIGQMARAAIHELDPRQVVERPALVDAILDEKLAGPRLLTWLVGLTSALALALAALGIYGLVAYAVRQRTREIGIRSALGASSTRIVLETLRRALVLVGLGVALGALASVPLVTALRASTFMPAAGGLMPVAIAAALFVVVGALAGLLPARRAAKVDPMIALRAE